MSQRSDVSIVTPTKNRLELLCRTIESVQRQSFAGWEHIVVDDGSNDGTAEEVARRAASDPRIRYIGRSGEKSGANVCRNIGLRESRAGLVVFLDSDDLLRPRCLERRIEIMRNNEVLDFSVFRAGVFSKTVGDLTRLFHPQAPGDDLLRFLSHECVWEITGPIWRRDFLEKIGGFDESLLSMQDLELHVRAICARGKYICLADVDHDISWQYDFTRTSVRHVYDPAYIEAVESVRAKLFANVENGGLMTWSRRRALVGLSFGAAESWAVRERRLGKSICAWVRSSRRQAVPLHLWFGGLVMLCACRVGSKENSLFARLVNKWKGWVRFRQEPMILEEAHTNATREAVSTDRSSQTARAVRK